MGNYYAESLNSQKLFQVYDTALPRIEQYFREEIEMCIRDSPLCQLRVGRPLQP